MPGDSPQPFYIPVSEPKRKSGVSNPPSRQTLGGDHSPVVQPLEPSPDTPLNPFPFNPAGPSPSPSPYPSPIPSSPIGSAPASISGVGAQMGQNPHNFQNSPNQPKPSQSPHFSENTSKDPVINQFTSFYNASLASAKSGNQTQARAHYGEMLKLYQQIASRPDLHDMNKDIAHFCVQDVYDSLSQSSDPGMARLTFGALLGVTIVLILIGGVIASNPSVVGLATGFSIFGPPSPAWIGGEPQVLITGPTTLRLVDLFSTNDKAPLTFLATSGNGVDAIVSGDFVTLSPKHGISGTSHITLIASRQDAPAITGSQDVDVTVA